MRRGFTLIELVLTVIVLSILSAFTFSVIWQYSNMYADTRGGFVYGEAAAVMERITRELRDARAVDPVSSDPANPSRYINFQLAHATPTAGGGSSAPCWVQYCICKDGTISTNPRVLLYRVQNTSQGATDQCENQCPSSSSSVPANVMSRSIMSSHSSTATILQQGFRVLYVQGNTGDSGPEGDGYEVTLAMAANPAQPNRYDSPPTTGNPSIVLVSRVSPRNFLPYTTDSSLCYSPTGCTTCPPCIGLERAFYGGYNDAVQ